MSEATIEPRRHETELTWLSTRELARRIDSGEVSAREALSDQLARIDSVNPLINAIVARDDERALAQAKLADEVHARGERMGPLHGVPMTHKESTDVAGWRTTKGSPIRLNQIATADALVIARLHSAGVITSGKTNVPEFTAGSHTFNSLFGTTVNPYDTTKSAAGSSGGAAAAIAAGVQASGDGSDMGGSLRTPGAFNNIVGMRPTNGRIPHALPANPWEWLAQSGFMARTVEDVALLMSAACGPSAGAPASIPEPGTVFERAEFSAPEQHLPGAALRDLRVGFSVDLGALIPVAHDVATIVGAAAGVIERAGAQVDDKIPDLSDADEVFRVTRAYDFAADYREYVRHHRNLVKSDVIWNTELGLALTVDELVSASEARVRLQGVVETYFAHHDVLALTASQVAPFDANIEYPGEINGRAMHDYLEWMRAATIISATGCPAISVPCGFTQEGLPVGLQLVAAPGRDVELLLAAQAFQEVTNHHLKRPAM